MGSDKITGHKTLTPHERLRNQRPTLVVPTDVSTSVKNIWIGNVLLLETFLVNFLPAPEPFRLKDALRWVWGFFIYLFVGSFDDPEQGGELFSFGISMQSRAGILL